MNKTVRVLIASLLTVLTLTFTAVPASAAQQTAAVDHAGTVVQTVEAAVPDASQMLVTNIRRLTDEEVEAISDKLSEQSRVYLVELDDGRYTYYIAVDFRMEDAVYLAKLPVMRKTAHKLYDRSTKMAEEENADKSPVLMDYTHIVGEMGVHYFIFRVTDLLGGESLKGLLGKVYQKSVMADLNIDESRFPFLIRIVGFMIGK